MIDQIKSYLHRDDFYDLNAKDYVQKEEVERRIRDDYILKYASLITNARVDEEYKRLTEEVTQRLPNKMQRVSNYVLVLKGQQRLERICSDFCSKEKLAGATDKLIEIVVKVIQQNDAQITGLVRNSNNRGTGDQEKPPSSESPSYETQLRFQTQSQSSSCQWHRVRGEWKCYTWQQQHGDLSSTNKPVTITTPIPTHQQVPNPTKKPVTITTPIPTPVSCDLVNDISIYLSPAENSGRVD